jgi:16S rRNA processing protein RimM
LVAQPTERLRLLDPGRRVLVAGRELTVESRKGRADRPIVKLSGVDGRELRGEAITVPRSAIGRLGQTEFLVDDLIGAAVFDAERPLGRVTDVLLMPSADVLEVERGEGERLLVPLVGDAVRSIDLERGRIEVDSGFLDAD